MSQGDVEKRTGRLRCYISQVENGHTVPSVDTLEKMARAVDPAVPAFHWWCQCEEGQIYRSKKTPTRAVTTNKTARFTFSQR